MSKNPLLQTLIAMTGQDNVITVHRPFVEFTGTLEAAMMLSQLLYWTPRAKIAGGWIAKSDKDWNKELCLARYSSRSATKTLGDMEIIETQLKKFKGSPTTHYRIRWEVLEKKWIEWVGLSENGQTECLETDNPLSENGQSLTETTSETTSDIKPSAEKKPAKPVTPPEIKLFREVTERYPNKINYENVVALIQGVSKRVGHECTAEDLRPFYAAWCANGWNKLNLAWLSYAEHGELPSAQKKNSYQAGTEPKAFDGIRKFLEAQNVNAG